MRKILVAISLLVYFTVSTGFVINLHYCMDEMASVELSHEKSDKCGKCGMPKKDKDGCCRDEVKVVKLNQDQLVSSFVNFQFSSPIIQVSFSEYQLTDFNRSFSYTSYKAHAPPLLGAPDTYLVNRVFRI